jgi:hypothetical protein
VDQRPAYYRPHYHIQWERKDTLDWECFQSYSEAKTRAAELAERDENFTIEEVSSECPMRRIKTASRGESQISD